MEAFGVCEVERGWRLTSVPMDSPTLHYVLKGEGVLESGNSRVPIGPGDIIVAPSGARKNFVGPGEMSDEIAAREACVLREDGLACFRACETRADLVVACAAVSATCAGGYGLFDRLSDPLVERVEDPEPFRSAFAAMLEEFSKPAAGAVTLAEALMKQCLVLMLRSHVQRFGLASPFLAHLVDDRLARAVDLMVSAPAAAHSLGSLAATAGMSRSAFAARFTSAYGAFRSSSCTRCALRPPRVFS